jgi:enoyl-CoA hydratase
MAPSGSDSSPDPDSDSGSHPDETLLSRREGDILVLTMNRPGRLNAVSLPLYERLDAALEPERDGADGIRAIALTGAGRAFSVGADLKAHGEADPTPEQRRAYVRLGQRVNLRLQRAPVPVVAAVNGHAIGAGLELALSADLVVVAREARLRFPEVALGTFVGGGVTYTLPARVGLARARELLLLGRFMSGSEAAEMGLANFVAPQDEVLPLAMEVARELAATAPVSLGLARELLREAPGRSPDEALRAEEEALLRCMETEDWKEGIRAFHEKRTPRFRGA